MRRSDAGIGSAASRSSTSAAAASPGRPNAAQTAATVARVVVSSRAMARVSPSTRRRFTPRASASAPTWSARPGTRTVMVSKDGAVTTSTPPRRSPSASTAARRCTRGRRCAGARRARGTWRRAARSPTRSTCAVQMLLVAFSRRMCCSRVWSARRSAGRPPASTDTPTSRPGRLRLYASRVAMNPAWGPPKPSGTPKRWAEPTTTSAPHSPGGVSSVQREQVGGDGHERALRVERARRARAGRARAPLDAGVLQEHAEDALGRQVGLGVADHDLDAERLGPGRHDLDGLRVGVDVDEERVAGLARSPGGTAPSPRPPRWPRRAATRWPPRCR